MVTLAKQLFLLGLYRKKWNAIRTFKDIARFRGGSREGVGGVATPPLSNICFLLFCLILPKLIRLFTVPLFFRGILETGRLRWSCRHLGL